MDIFSAEFERIVEAVRSEMVETEAKVHGEWVTASPNCDLSIYEGIRVSGSSYDPVENALVLDSESFSFFFAVDDIADALSFSTAINEGVLNAGASLSGGLIGGPVLNFETVSGREVLVNVITPDESAGLDAVFLRVVNFGR